MFLVAVTEWKSCQHTQSPACLNCTNNCYQLNHMQVRRPIQVQRVRRDAALKVQGAAWFGTHRWNSSQVLPDQSEACTRVGWRTSFLGRASFCRSWRGEMQQSWGPESSLTTRPSCSLHVHSKWVVLGSTTERRRANRRLPKHPPPPPPPPYFGN